ncbi:RNA polymerase sigma factor [Sphingobacterium corticibacterium]|uniref:Sigma-70 family RNA polymerase sigma factor n=1 Tax=Sphingobacterium corticibacterium TaxID=2484746 RepID=A0A4Q6XPL8_9SPHI|nr:sigma-70 family RNA polymerase sigma factor [Sphingobacterium corticibacterium]RZF61645.1 sigma-70 family RNA polymerase sigma factor [Sphingobacterium corticibacterium]
MDEQKNYFDRLKKGDEVALDYYIKNNIQTLTFFAYKHVRDEQLSEELACDSFVKLWHNKHLLKNESHLQNFLFRVTRNACLNYLEKLKKQPVLDYDLASLDIADDHDINRKIIYAEFLKLIYNELEKLPKQQALIFKMSFLDGYSTEEICAILKTSKNNVFYAKSKAQATLRLLLKKRKFELYNLLVLAYFYQP